MARRFNYRRVKIHRSYTVAELANLIGAHRQTVLRWIVAGSLPTTDAKRPHLIHGEQFRVFMLAHEPIKQKLSPGEIYCLGCRAPKRPAGDMAEYVPYTPTRGAISGICPTCSNMVYRAVARAKVNQISGGLDVAYPRAEQRLNDTSSPLSNVDFHQD
jgi:excisionase family DNA binding protein